MYSFEPSEEQKMLVDAINRYAVNDLRKNAREAEESGQLPDGLIEKGWELGLLQASIPEAYSGFGEHSTLTSALAAEEMAYGDLAGAMAVMTPALFALPILLAGSEAQKQFWLPKIVSDAWVPYTAALLEPAYDFDPCNLKTTTTRSGDKINLNGEKMYVPFASEAKAILVYAKDEGKTQGFIVPKDVQGMVVGERQKLLGLNAIPVHALKLNNVVLPIEHKLGEADGHDFSRILDLCRITMASLAVGLSKAAFEYARDYAKDRDVFGVKAAQKQVIAFMLAEMATEIEAIRLLTWEAAWKMDNHHDDASKHAVLAHTGAADMAIMVTDRAVQILGGHGYIREHPVEMWLRNGRGIAMLTGLAIA